MSDAARVEGSGYIPAGERVLLSLKPDPASIVLIPMWTLTGLGVVAAAATWLAGAWPETAWISPGRVWLWAGVAAAARIGWQAADWAARRFVLTDRRVLRIAGVFRRSVVDVPLENIQHATLTRLFRERLTGLGTLGFASSGTAWVEMHWTMIAEPVRRLEIVRREVEAASGRARGGGGA
jgi:hypothetical protein